MARFEDTGRVTPRRRRELGLVGPAARACGLERDVRHDSPVRHLPLRPHPRHRPSHTGDVFARAYVRWLEIQRSVDFLRDAAATPCPSGRYAARPGAARARSPRGVAGRRLARRDLPRGDDRRDGPLRALQGRRPVVPQLDRAWRWRCATSRSPTSRSATRASTSRTAGTTSERAPAMLEDRSSRGCRQRAPHACRYPDGRRRRCPTASAGLPGARRARGAPTAAAPAPSLPDRGHRRSTAGAARSTWAAASSAPTAPTPVPRAPSRYTDDYRLAARRARTCVLGGRRTRARRGARRRSCAGSSAAR